MHAKANYSGTDYNRKIASAAATNSNRWSIMISKWCPTTSGHLGQWIGTILAIFHSPAPRRLHMKFEQYWPWGFRGGHLKFSTFFPYKCIGKQTWPQPKKVKYQCTTISNFGRHPPPPPPRTRWFVQRFSPKASSVLEKKIFKGFYHIWAWRSSWSTPWPF